MSVINELAGWLEKIKQLFNYKSCQQFSLRGTDAKQVEVPQNAK